MRFVGMKINKNAKSSAKSSKKKKSGSVSAEGGEAVCEK